MTDTSVGEAAYQILHGVECAIVSATPSEWDFSPIKVTWNREAEDLGNLEATIDNWRDAAALEEKLEALLPPILSWSDLEDFSRSQFSRLTFSKHCFGPLKGVPYSRSAAKRIRKLLDTLDCFASEFDIGGSRTPEGNKMYQDYFMGDRAWYSDSSDSEKSIFRTQLRFPHPDKPGEFLFCTWHGKESSALLRLHFSWPVRANEPVYVVYCGQKITKQ